jgi:RimJ/RimL family protein N-acetyltransferase
MKHKILRSNRLELVPINKTHVTQNYVDWLNDEEVYKHLVTKGEYSLERLEEYIINILDNNIFMWAITTRNNNKHIGNIKMDPIDYENKSVELGILIGDKSEWGKGLAKEAINSIVEFFFNELRFDSITLGVEKENTRAISLYKNLGFDQLMNISSESNLRMILKNADRHLK